MRKSIECLLSGLVLLSLIAFSVAHAEGEEEKWYVGINYAALNYEDDVLGTNFKSKIPALVVKGGWQFHDNLAVEVRVGVGIGNETLRREVTAAVPIFGTITTTVDRTFNLESLYGVYLRPGVNLGKRVHLYGMFGLTEAKTSVSYSVPVGGVITAGSASGVLSSLSYGGGLDFTFSKHIGVHLEYMSYYDQNNATIGGFAAGIQYRF